MTRIKNSLLCDTTNTKYKSQQCIS